MCKTSLGHNLLILILKMSIVKTIIILIGVTHTLLMLVIYNTLLNFCRVKDVCFMLDIHELACVQVKREGKLKALPLQPSIYYKVNNHVFNSLKI